ncbi:MAG: TraB/GumN family protein [Bacteroides sp.]|nr:TraB/GumN family protein [Bacteroides sp.]
MKKLFLLASLALAAFSANAQLLWKVSGNNAAGDSYIFGTHHVAPLAMIDSIKGTMPALESADLMMGEIDMISSPENMMQISMTYAMAPSDSTLTKVFTPDEINEINAVLSKYSGGQLSCALLDALKPAMVGTQLAMLQTMTSFPGYNPAEQLDQTLQQVATANGKKVEGLETIESQFQLLMGNPISEQAKDLLEAVRNEEKSVVKAQQLAAAYMAEDLPAIEELILNDPDSEPEAIDRLITNRNGSWVEILKTKLPQQSIFIAVGAGHLIGEKGLINQLRQAGYTLTPVSNEK